MQLYNFPVLTETFCMIFLKCETFSYKLMFWFFYITADLYFNLERGRR